MANTETENNTEDNTKDAFMARPYKNADRDRREDEELEELERQNREASNPEANKDKEDEDAGLTREEKNWKKRYGDLRSHMSTTTNALKEEIEKLKNQVKESTSTSMKLPKTDEELEEWSKANPDMAAFIETLASKRIREARQDIDTRFEEVNKRDRETQEEAALLKLREKHPDFDELQSSDDFHDWLETQPTLIQNSIYEDSTDWRSASRAIDLYKADMGLKAQKSTSRNRDKEAASSVKARERTNVSTDTGPRSFKESEIEAMTDAQYEELETEIEAANKAGRIIRDLSGGAR